MGIAMVVMVIIDTEVQDNILCYNAYTNSFLFIKKTMYKLFRQYSDRIDELASINKNLFDNLVTNGFIIEDNKNEKEEYLDSYYRYRVSKERYHLFINPTLGCNLDCWYCYEDHKSFTKMSPEMIDRVMKHLDQKYTSDPFKYLQIGFFGGEPLLYFDVVKELLSKIKQFTDSRQVQLRVHFTTNGVLINESRFLFLKDFHPYFQISLDGNKENHDKSRVPKTKQPTYDKILKNIEYLSWKEEVDHICVRINYTDQTINGLLEILDDMNKCNRNKIHFDLQRVWQTNAKSIDKKLVFGFVREAQKKGFRTEYLPLYYNYESCYADKYNEAVINYDGNVFKCTARDFVPENAEGVLQEDGTIQWNQEKVNRRMNTKIQDTCLDCKLLPSCNKICTQNLIEKGNSGCKIENDLNFADYILHNFTNQIILKHA